MKVRFNCNGWYANSHDYDTIEYSDELIKNMTKEQIEEMLEEDCFNWVMEKISYYYDILEDDNES